jgi:hypothetical protein
MKKRVSAERNIRVEQEMGVRDAGQSKCQIPCQHQEDEPRAAGGASRPVDHFEQAVGIDRRRFKRGTDVLVHGKLPPVVPRRIYCA